MEYEYHFFKWKMNQEKIENEYPFVALIPSVFLPHIIYLSPHIINSSFV